MTGTAALLLPAGEDLLAVPLDAVREVVTAPALSPLPTAPPTVLGLCNLRGEIVPILDTAAVIGTDGDPWTSRCPFAAIVSTAAGPVGLAASGLARAGELGDPADVVPLGATAGAFVVDGRGPRRVASMLSLDAIVSTVRSTAR